MSEPRPRLDRPPGERYADETAAAASRPHARPSRVAPDLRGGAVYAAGAALLAVALWVGASALDVRAGILAVAVFAGWLVGTAASTGSWRGAERPTGVAGRPTGGTERPAGGTERPTGDAGRPTGGTERPTGDAGRRVAALALVAAGLAWIGGQVGVYLFQMAVTPAAATTVWDRIAATPIADFYAGQAGPLDALALLLLLGVAGWSAR